MISHLAIVRTRELSEWWTERSSLDLNSAHLLIVGLQRCFHECERTSFRRSRHYRGECPYIRHIQIVVLIIRIFLLIVIIIQFMVPLIIYCWLWLYVLLYRLFLLVAVVLLLEDRGRKPGVLLVVIEKELVRGGQILAVMVGHVVSRLEQFMLPHVSFLEKLEILLGRMDGVLRVFKGTLFLFEILNLLFRVLLAHLYKVTISCICGRFTLPFIQNDRLSIQFLFNALYVSGDTRV